MRHNRDFRLDQEPQRLSPHAWAMTDDAGEIIADRAWQLGARLTPEDIAAVRAIMINERLSPRRAVKAHLERTVHYDT